MAVGIDCDTYIDRVEIKMLGEKPITIKRPTHIPMQEWKAFWGAKHYYTHKGFGRPFTQKDAEDNNQRRLTNFTK